MDSRYPAIRPLPEEVATQIKSSSTLSSLEHVVVGLFKNALDAGSRRIDISVGFRRGACTVEDDGLGISPEEFLDTGGLGKAFYTSKVDAASTLHGGEGVFLASLAAMSILKITSHHHTNRSAATLVLHHTRPAARLVPAPSQNQLLNRDHGTKVEVHDLFGNMPVRVKQRGLDVSNQSSNSREWESIRRNLVGLLLAWNISVDVTMRNPEGGGKLIIKSKGSDRKRITEGHPTSKPFDLDWTCSLLSQAGYVEPDTWHTWIRTSARTPLMTIRGAFSMQPVETKRTQFVSLGIRHLGTDTGANVLYNEINRIFALSSFGNAAVSSGDEATKKMQSSDRRYKKHGHTSKQLRGTGKGVDRWPMFVVRIDLQEETSKRFAGLDCFGQESTLSGIVKVLEAMVTGFLNDHHFRPRKSRKRPRPASIDQHCLSLGPPGTMTSPIARKTRLESVQIGPQARQGHIAMAFGQDLIGYTIQVPKVKVDLPQYADEGFGMRSRIKSGNSRGTANGSAMSENPSTKGSEPLDSTRSSQLRPAHPMADTLKPKPLDQPSNYGSLALKEAQSGLESIVPEHAIDETAPDVRTEDTFAWTNPTTKEIVSVSSRTGLAVPCPQRTRSAAAMFSPATCASPFVAGSVGNQKLSRCKSAPTVPKAGSWVSSFLRDWENPVFAPAREQDIPRVSSDGPNLEVSDSIHDRGHRCSRLDPEKGFSVAPSALSSKLSKAGLANANIISQVDKKFILVKMAPFPRDATDQASGRDDRQLLVLIDQHAADERIRVENLLADLCTLPSTDMLRMTSSFNHKPAIATVLLPKPISSQVKHQEHHMFAAHAQHFAKWGILFDLSLPQAGPTPLETPPCKITVKALPPIIAERCRLEPKLLIELLRKEIWKREENGTRTMMIPSVLPPDDESAEPEHDDKISHWLNRISTCPQGILDMLNNRSCRSAIMFNDELSVEECEVLVKRLAKCRFPFQCAHGRPSMVPLVAVGNGFGGENGFVGGDGGETDEAEESYTNAWRRWKGKWKGHKRE